MEKYRIITEINKKIIFGEEILYTEKKDTVSALLNGIDCREDILKYKKRMGVSSDTYDMYPNYYIPPYDGNRKQRLIQGFLPKTNILYANHYELEIIRLLYMFDPENERVGEMVRKTRQRLKNTCFGNFCTKGECKAAGISILRFLAVTQPNDLPWIEKLLNPLGDIFLSYGKGQTVIHNGIPLSYMLMAFTDINNEKTKELIGQRKEWLSGLLGKGRVKSRMTDVNQSEKYDYKLMKKYIIKNALNTLPEYRDVYREELFI